MTMENSVSFKVFLHKEGITEQPEVRRFGIDRDVVSNFSYLNQKLQAVFPSLQGKSFTVHWKDADGDSIVITSDDELMIALTEMQTDVRKLYVVVNKELPKSQPEPRQDGTGNSYPVHTGVSCDGCGKGVIGFRYKCVQCPNYDLCGTCEAANMHGDHFMIRVPVPITWRPYFGRRLAHHLCKSARKSGQPCGGWGEAPEGVPCSAGTGPYPCHARAGHGRHRGHHAPQGPNWLETLSSYLSEWTNLPGEASTPAAGEGSEGEQKQRQQQQECAAEQHMKYLRSVGQTVANILNPLGIDVDIEVHSTNDSGEKVTKKDDGKSDKNDKNMPAPKNVSFAENESETNMKEVASQINHLTINDNGTGPEVVASNERTSPESDDWTVLTGMDTQQTDSPGPSTSASAGAIPKHPFNAFPSPAAPPGFYEAAHQAAMLSAQQVMAAHEAHMVQVNEEHQAAKREAQASALREMEQASDAARRVAEERAFRQAQAMAASGNNNLYPNLGIQTAASPSPFQIPVQSQQPQHQQQRVHHPQPHISQAVDQMMSMGFNNEGGWLTQLLATHNGNITKALDVLQPVKK